MSYVTSDLRVNYRLGRFIMLAGGGDSRVKRKTTRDIIFLSFLAILLVACQSPQEGLEKTSEKLSLPKDTALLASMIEESQGSQDACFFTSLTRLYGSSLSYDVVMDFYTTDLSDKGWTQDFPLWLPEEILSFRRGDEYTLGVSDVTSNEFILQRFKDVNSEELKAYLTIYTVTISYADWIARRYCPAAR